MAVDVHKDAARKDTITMEINDARIDAVTMEINDARIDAITNRYEYIVPYRFAVTTVL